MARITAKSLIGRTIIHAEYMTAEDTKLAGWWQRPLMLTLDDGTVLYPSSDDEGNDAGALFGVGPGGRPFSFPRKMLR